MNIEAFRDYCLAKPGVTEETPFGPDTLVLKVMGKMFTACGLDAMPFQVNLKCDPDRALELREQYADIIPGYHMNKKHWNTVIVGNGDIPKELFFELIDHSYELVVAGLSRKLKADLDDIGG